MPDQVRNPEDRFSHKADIINDLWCVCAAHMASTEYRKVPKFSDTRNLCCKLSRTQRKRPNLKVFCQKHANGIANSEDPDQTAPLGYLSVRKLRIITVHWQLCKQKYTAGHTKTMLAMRR